MSGLPRSGHDFGELRRRWEGLATSSGLRLGRLCQDHDWPVLVVENEAAASGAPGGIYASAGVHGDECAPVWALLEWVASASAALADRPLVVFPCLNPIGLAANTRLDGSGRDLNRIFHDAGHPLIGAWQEFLRGRRFDLAVNLHEDYDASGIYLYELTEGPSEGEGLLAACETVIPRETATEVDGAAFVAGLLTHRGDLREVVETRLAGGFPEAIHLFLNHAERALTFETPSEFDLFRRIAAHRAFLEAAVDGLDRL